MIGKVGPYEVVREVARGGMGVVFQVKHPNVPRPLALKLILDKGADSTRYVQRFQREAEILAQCDRHANVLKVHHLGTDQGRPYLVTDFIDGDALATRIPLEPRSAALVIRKVADALAHVHAKGVLHRDVKPDNILLRKDAPDEPVLIDFGLAWAEDQERLTRTGATLGTPHYMSPEQAGGAAGARLDARSDVYSLGATLFAALTGEPPFAGDTLTELVAKIMTEPPRVPSDSRDAVPTALDAICAVALAKRPDDRYATAAEMRDDLDRFLAGKQPLAVKRAPRRRRRGSGARLAVALLALAVLGGAGLYAAQLLAERASRQGRERAVAATLDAAKAAGAARRSDDARGRIEALEASAATIDPPDARCARLAAFLRAELEARAAREATTPDPRARALDRAATATRAYLAGGEVAGGGADDLLDDLSEREALLAATLADGGPADLARALLARAEGTTRGVLVERARALLRLGDPSAAARTLEKLAPADATSADALALHAVALLECRELPAARNATTALLPMTRGDATAHARAVALAARIELAAGDLDAALRLLDPDAGADPELVLARCEADLARRVRGAALAPPLLEVLGRTRDESLALRAGELLGRIRVLDALEHYVAREAPPTFDLATETLEAALARFGLAGSVGGGGAETARPAAARALVLLAALARMKRDDAAASAALARAAAVAPAAVDPTLATPSANATLHALLVELAEERIAFAENAEAFVAHGLAARRRANEEQRLVDEGQEELLFGLLAAAGTRRRGDGTVAAVALDLALALRPLARSVAPLRAAAVAQLLRMERPDVLAVAPDLVAFEPAGRIYADAHGGPEALAAEAFADAEAARVAAVTDDLVRARDALVRGRLLAASSRTKEALPLLDAAQKSAATVLATRDQETVTPVRLAEASRVRSTALHETALAVQRAPDSSMSAAAARSPVDDDLEDRGSAILAALAETKALQALLKKVANNSSEVGVTSEAQPRVLALRDSLMALLRSAPGCSPPLDVCVSADVDCGRGPRAWIWEHRYYLGRGGMGSVYSELTMRFVSYLEAEGADMDNTLLSKENVDELSRQSPPDDAAPVLARATRRILALRVQTPDPAELRKQLSLADADLRLARRLAPGTAAVLPWRAALAVKANRTAEARAYFEATRELSGWSSRTIEFTAWEALCWARAKRSDAARSAIEAIRDSKDTVKKDRWILDNRVFHADIGRSADLAAIYETVVAPMRDR